MQSPDAWPRTTLARSRMADLRRKIFGATTRHGDSRYYQPSRRRTRRLCRQDVCKTQGSARNWYQNDGHDMTMLPWTSKQSAWQPLTIRSLVHAAASAAEVPCKSRSSSCALKLSMSVESAAAEAEAGDGEEAGRAGGAATVHAASAVASTTSARTLASWLCVPPKRTHKMLIQPP